jgi:hypothetical protein
MTASSNARRLPNRISFVSEDKDLLRLGRYGDTKIVTIRDFTAQALGPGRQGNWE